VVVVEDVVVVVSVLVAAPRLPFFAAGVVGVTVAEADVDVLEEEAGDEEEPEEDEEVVGATGAARSLRST